MQANPSSLDLLKEGPPKQELGVWALDARSLTPGPDGLLTSSRGRGEMKHHHTFFLHVKKCFQKLSTDHLPASCNTGAPI